MHKRKKKSNLGVEKEVTQKSNVNVSLVRCITPGKEKRMTSDSISSSQPNLGSPVHDAQVRKHHSQSLFSKAVFPMNE